VSTKDHNETLVGIHFVIGSVFALGSIWSAWIIAENVTEAKQIPFAILLFGTVLLVAILMFATAIAMRRQKPVGRKLGLAAAGVLIVLFWPAGVYSWWFFHSAGAKRMYRVQKE
jgi:heme/copper-type cytochrome/quinol oxidase subunit 3